MFYSLHLLEDWYSRLRVFRYITVRAVAGAGTAFLLSVLLGPWLIRGLKRLNIGQYERKEEAPPPEPTTKECPFCCSTIAIKATRCPQCTSELSSA